MIIFKLLFAHFLPWLLGAAFLICLLRTKLQNYFLAEKLALSFCTGWGLNVIIMFLLSFLNIKLTWLAIVVVELLLIILLFLLSYKVWPLFFSNLKTNEKAEFSWFRLSLFLLISFKVVAIFWGALIKPILEPDLIVCYTMAAKMIFLNGQIPVGWPLGDETVFLPLSQAWAALNLNYWDDSLLILAEPLLFICLLITFYYTLKRSNCSAFALLGTYLLCSIPFLSFHAGTAYADFPQAFYYSVSTFYLYLFIKEGINNKTPSTNGHLLISLILLGLTIWVKRSGLYYAGINLLVLSLFLIYKRKAISTSFLKELGFALLLFIFISLPWLCYEPFLSVNQYWQQTLSSIQGTAVDKQLLPIRGEINQVTGELIRNVFLEDNWHLLGIMFIAAIIFFFNRLKNPAILSLIAIICLQLMALVVIFMFTDRAFYVTNETLLNRLMLHFIPVIGLLVAELVAELTSCCDR